MSESKCGIVNGSGGGGGWMLTQILNPNRWEAVGCSLNWCELVYIGKLNGF